MVGNGEITDMTSHDGMILGSELTVRPSRPAIQEDFWLQASRERNALPN